MLSLRTQAFQHLGGELFKIMTGTQIVHVPYKGGGASVAAVVAGESQWTFTPAAAVMSLIRAGRLRAIAVTTAQPVEAWQVPGSPPPIPVSAHQSPRPNHWYLR